MQRSYKSMILLIVFFAEAFRRATTFANSTVAPPRCVLAANVAVLLIGLFVNGLQ